MDYRDKLKAIAEDENVPPAVRSILYSLLGAIAGELTHELAGHCSEFSKVAMELIKKEQVRQLFSE